MTSTAEAPWESAVERAVLVKGGRVLLEGETTAWDNSLRLQFTFVSSADGACRRPRELEELVCLPMLAVSAHARYAGLWAIERVDEREMTCIVPRYEGDAPPPPTFDVTWSQKRADGNLCAVRFGAQDASTPRARIAPPLRFHARATVFSVDSIDTVNQSFHADVAIEYRLRAICNEPNEPLTLELLRAYGFRPELVDTLNTSAVDQLERWSSVSKNSERRSKVDYSVRLRARATFTEEFELAHFPFDEQPVTIRTTVNLPSTRALVLPNGEYPSIFLSMNFQLSSMFDLPLGKHVRAEPSLSDPLESAIQLEYPRLAFAVVLRRKYGYFLNHVAIPVSTITVIAPLSAATEPDGSRMGTGDRLAFAVTLLLTAIAYKFVIASALPQVSYLTTVEAYTLVCFGFMWANVVEAALWPSFAYRRVRAGTEDEGVAEIFNEWLWALAYLLVFATYNLVFWLRVRSQLAARARERSAELDALEGQAVAVTKQRSGVTASSSAD